MASEEENKQQDEVIGFPGLSSMVSDVDDTVASEEENKQQDEVIGFAGLSSMVSDVDDTIASTPEHRDVRGVSEVAQPWGSKLFMPFVIVAVSVALLSGLAINGITARRQPQAPSLPVEDRSSIGRNIVLSTAQIRDCLAEKIRLEAAESVIDISVHSDVVRFNAYVEDYNRLCAEFDHEGTLESARRDIEPHRSELVNEGRSRFVR